jgi:hypothetical protein
MDGSDEAEKMLGAWLGFRENIAAQLLFGDCLKKFESSSRRNAMMNMFGKNAVITTSSYTIPKSSSRVESVKQPNVKTKTIAQAPISSYLLDSFIVDNMKKKERAAAAAAKKKMKEQMEVDSD